MDMRTHRTRRLRLCLPIHLLLLAWAYNRQLDLKALPLITIIVGRCEGVWRRYWASEASRVGFEGRNKKILTNCYHVLVLLIG